MNKKTVKMEQHVEWILAVRNCIERMGLLE